MVKSSYVAAPTRLMQLARMRREVVTPEVRKFVLEAILDQLENKELPSRPRWIQTVS